RRIPAPERLTLVDRDARALAFARESIEAGAPGVEVEARDSVGGGSFDLALVSHVLDELDDHGASALVGVLRGAESILWVEPGSKRTSRRLSTLRAELLDAYDVVAPCTHVEACGVLDPRKRRDWCHFFAKPPAEVHTTAEWTQIGRELRIDLRSLPYAFLFLTRRPEGATASGSGGPRRVLGRPRVQRGRVMIDLCGPEGTSTEQLQQRDDKALYKALKKDTTILRFDPR
ncbi:MAG: small ribosomal subunit Rsm22 family protein, partial [Planctomycetota bacterium]